MKIRDTTH